MHEIFLTWIIMAFIFVGMTFQWRYTTLWFQLEDMFQLIVTAQGNEKVTIQLKDTPTKGNRYWVLIQLIVMPPHILQKGQSQIKEMCRLEEPSSNWNQRVTNIEFYIHNCRFDRKLTSDELHTRPKKQLQATYLI